MIFDDDSVVVFVVIHEGHLATTSNRKSTLWVLAEVDIVHSISVVVVSSEDHLTNELLDALRFEVSAT